MNVGTMIGKSRDWKPRYRQRGYKGNLTEDEKRFLDSFRNGEPHPATSFEDLLGEVQCCWELEAVSAYKSRKIDSE